MPSFLALLMADRTSCHGLPLNSSDGRSMSESSATSTDCHPQAAAAALPVSLTENMQGTHPC